MALIKTPDGGFYVNDDEFEVNYSTNSISLTGQGGGGVAGVSSFNGRTGAVVPQDGDYTAEQVGAASTDTVNTMSEYIHDIVEGVEPLPYLPETYTPPIATANSVGTIKPGTGMEVTADGTLNCTVAPGTSGITQEQADDRYLQLSGGTMTGALNMGANKITTTTTPTETSDVTNKGYVDGVVRVVSDEVDGIIAGTTSISVPIATDVKVGGVKIGAGLSVDGEGTLTTAQTYLSTQGGTLEANASITGEDAMTFEVPDSTESATVGITAQGVTITHNTNSDVDSSIRAIDNAIEIKANDTTVTINGTGVALGGAAISGINSLAGQSSNEIAIESDVDMNSHNLTNVGNINTSGGLNIESGSGAYGGVRLSNASRIILSNESTGYSGIVVGADEMGISCSSTFSDSDSDIQFIIMARPIESEEEHAIIIGNNYMGDSFEPDSGGGITINGNNIISIISPQPINFNNNRLTGVANPTDGSDAVNLTYFQSNLPAGPENATTSTAGLVRQINYISKLSSEATLTDVIDAFNQLLTELLDAGIMVSPS